MLGKIMVRRLLLSSIRLVERERFIKLTKWMKGRAQISSFNRKSTERSELSAFYSNCWQRLQYIFRILGE